MNTKYSKQDLIRRFNEEGKGGLGQGGKELGRQWPDTVLQNRMLKIKTREDLSNVEYLLHKIFMDMKLS